MKGLTKILPQGIRKIYLENAKYARMKNEEKAVGMSIFNGIILTFLISLIISRFFELKTTIILGIVIFTLVQIFMFYYLVLKSEAIGKKIEEVLPDALQLMASNLRAGMTTEKALLLSSRNEFGYLKHEIDKIGREIATGKTIILALKEMSERFRSEKLKKAVQLINSGLASGGSLAPLLEQISANLRESEFVEKKVRTNVLTYVIFIFIAISFGAPIMFGLSSFLIEVLTTQISQINIPTATSAGLPFSISAIDVSIDFIINYVLVLMATSAILGGLVLGLIARGKEKEGIKYIPLIIVISFSLFFIVRFIIKNVLSGVFGL